MEQNGPLREQFEQILHYLIDIDMKKQSKEDVLKNPDEIS